MLGDDCEDNDNLCVSALVWIDWYHADYVVLVPILITDVGADDDDDWNWRPRTHYCRWWWWWWR